MSATDLRPAVPKWFWPVAWLGLVWNVFGAFQFLSKVQGTVGSLMSTGLTKEQAELYTGLPLWMDVAFAIGVFGGAAGCLLLMLRLPVARGIFALSLVAYAVLYIGDIVQGVFAAFGAPQVVILTLVVAIAGGLLWVSVSQLKPSMG